MFLESDERVEFFFNDCILTELSIINFGHEKCLPEHSFGPQVREYYIIHYILDGKGVFNYRNNRYHLKKGDFFLISPADQDPVYQADNESPWEYIWLGFEGTKAEEVLLELGYNGENNVGHVLNQDLIGQHIQELITTNFLSQSSSLTIQGKLITILSLLSLDGTNISLNSNMSSHQKHIEQFCLYIRQNYWRTDLTVQKIADDLGLNSSYLSRIISRKFGESTLEYLIKYRMLKAKFMIENSDYKISAISKAVGYENPLSFSRAYKKIYGHSPRKGKNDQKSMDIRGQK
ncbi:AraC family transcriptional regulator [Heyndrickxia coagulans]|uniref:AraC family transcriptional regulator n=1 Tax=Heyndrickxia coagulans TaxID=1398 RepID=UPI00040F19EB|nr:AraC family transcriptional regulator [Heyndrickxia coagulans]